MIERGVLKRKLKEFQVAEYIAETLDKPGYSHTEIQRTPLGEKIIVYTSKPGLIVGRKGASIRELTQTLKEKFGLENPQVEVSEIENPDLNPHAIAKSIVHSFERYGTSRFKYLGYKLLQSIMDAGALGAEIVISGRGVPSVRAKSWRFSAGHMKKSGDIAESYVKKSIALAHLRSGAVGVKVKILTPDTILPDTIKIKEVVQEAKEEGTKEEEVKEEEVKESKPKKKTTKKKVAKKEEKIPTATELKEKKANENGDNKKE